MQVQGIVKGLKEEGKQALARAATFANLEHWRDLVVMAKADSVFAASYFF